MKILLLFYLLLHFTSSYAQIRIVRDPLACAYGLQNQKNEWIVSPRFQQLLYLNDGFYACQFAEKWGLIKETGKQILDETHDQISIFKPGQFLIVDLIHTENASFKRMGILDTNLRWIIPQEYTSISRMERDHLLLTKSSKDAKGIVLNYSSICDEKGNLLFPFQEGWILNSFYLKESLLIGNTILGSHTAQGNVRCINLKGKVISDTTYDFGMPCTASFYIVKQKEKFGLISTSGKTIIPPKYTFEYNSYDYQNPIPCLHGHHQFIFIEKDKKGILNGQWKEIIPAKYQSVHTISSNETDYTSARYIAYDNSVQKYHLLDKNGVILQIADTFVNKFLTLPKTNYYELDKHKVYFYYGNRFGKNIKWGILNDKGEIILPSHYESIWITSTFEAMQIQTQFNPELPPKVSMLNLIDTAQKLLINLEFVSKMDSIYLYAYKDKFYPLLYLPSTQKWSNDLYGYQAPYSYGDFIIISGNANAFLIHKKLKTIQKYQSIEVHSGHFPILVNNKGMNVLHPKKGPLFQESHIQINQQFASINRIWVKAENGLWSIYDTLAQKRIQDNFDEIAYFWEDQVVKKNGLYGVLNTNCQWFVQPTFKEIYQLTMHCFVGLTPTGKVGAIHTNNSQKIDTSFQSFTPITYFSKDQLIYCLEKNNKKYFFDQNQTLLPFSEKEMIISHWTNAVEPSYLFYVNLLQNNPSLLSNFESTLYSLLYPYYQSNINEDNKVVRNGKRGESKAEKYNFEMTYLSSDKFSVHIFKHAKLRYDNHTESIDQYSYGNVSIRENWMVLNGVWKELKFNQLFNPKDTHYQKVILSALQKNSSIKIDCHDPSTFFNGATQYSFAEDGLNLYFFQDQADAFILKLNRNEIEQIPSAKWILKYL